MLTSQCRSAHASEDLCLILPLTRLWLWEGYIAPCISLHYNGCSDNAHGKGSCKDQVRIKYGNVCDA